MQKQGKSDKETGYWGRDKNMVAGRPADIWKKKLQQRYLRWEKPETRDMWGEKLEYCGEGYGLRDAYRSEKTEEKGSRNSMAPPMTRVRVSGPIWWKERIDSYKLSYNLYPLNR